jgi:hypothetical protein
MVGEQYTSNSSFRFAEFLLFQTCAEIWREVDQTRTATKGPSIPGVTGHVSNPTSFDLARTGPSLQIIASATTSAAKTQHTLSPANRSHPPTHPMAAAYRHVATRGLALALAAAVVTAWQCAAQRAPSGPGCMPELVSLNPCMDYMSGNATAPDGPCCSAVSGMLRASPSCLCMVVGGTAATLGVAVDGDRALRLPAACQVQAPPANQCDGKRT